MHTHVHNTVYCYSYSIAKTNINVHHECLTGWENSLLLLFHLYDLTENNIYYLNCWYRYRCVFGYSRYDMLVKLTGKITFVLHLRLL